jgi:hypothetical protein
MLGWVKLIAGPLLRLLRRPDDVAKVVESARDLVDHFRLDHEPSQPLTYKDVEHIRLQVDNATEHKVQPPPGPAMPVDRAAKTPPAKPPRRKKDR